MILRKSKENGVLSPDMANLGASFKQARESKGISLDQIAAETRISTRFLRAIENEEFNTLPGGIFNRGFVRAYAEKVGLDPDQAVADYERLAEVTQPAETPISPSAPSAKGERHLYPIAIAALVLLIIVFYVVTRESSNTAQTASSAPQPPAASPPVVVQPPPPTAPPPTTSAAAPEPEPAVPIPALRIDMDVNAATWIKVTADGTTVDPGENLEPGMTRHFTAQDSIGLIVGNAGGLSLKINDMPAKSLGKSGQVREVKITPANIKDFIG